MTEQTPGFEQLFSSKLFVMPRQAGDVGWCAYLLGRGDAVPDPVVPITIAQSFNQYNGHYLFALQAPALPDEAATEAFNAAVRAYLDQCYGPGFGQQFNGQACMWIPDPAAPDNASNCGAYDFAFGTTSGTTVFLSTTLNNPLGQQITFIAQSGLKLTPSDTGLVLTTIGGSALAFNTQEINYGPAITPNTARIPFFGRYSGCFLFTGQMDAAVTLAHFNAGFRYAHGNDGGATDSVQNYPLLATGQPGTLFNYVAALDPLDPVNGGSATVDLPNGKLRTLFAPVAANGGASPRFASWLRPTTNNALSLVALGGGDSDNAPVPFAGAFVFEYADSNAAPAALRPLYMTPAGDFALAVKDAPLSGKGAGATYELLCGLFGSETLGFRAYATDAPFDRLRFTPRQPSYAPVFPFPQATLDDPASGAVGARLTGIYSTAWAWLASGDTASVYYHAQPEGSPLYQSDGKADDESISVLSAYQPLTKLLYAPGRAVPLAPYAGFVAAPPSGFTPANLNDFESQIISPERKKIVAASVAEHVTEMKRARLARLAATGGAAATDAATDATTKTTTPQGLLAEVATGDIGADYVRVTLAQTDAPAGYSPQMAFNHLQTPLQNLFQTNQLFGVVVNPKNLGQLWHVPPAPPVPPPPLAPSFENTATIAGWTFTAEVGEGVLATDYRNVLIFKFADGTLRDRAKNPNKWAATGEFSLPDNAGDPGFALTGLSNWLQTFIEAAIAEADKGNTLYRNFKNIATNPNWNGILVLRADVDASGLPEQIRGLAAGINFSQFEAHHFGVTVSRVTVKGTDIRIDGLSTMFGLIDYQLPLFRQSLASGGNADFPLAVPTTGDYDFTVLQLQALFQNSALVDFRSRVQLNIGVLFGSNVTGNYSSGNPVAANAVVLRGSYQSQGTTSTYVFEQDSPTTFLLASNVLQAVSFTRVQFNTLTADSGGASPSIRSRFLFWGAFDFAVLLGTDGVGTDGVGGDPFDTFSFGSASGTPPASLGAGLSFSNLQINMESPVATPGAVAFSFDGSGLAFDLATSTVRDNSLFAGLSLQLDSFITSSGDKRPPDFGYLPVGAGIPLKALSGAWFGIVCKVTMGTPGALVSKAGFESRMLLAWNAQTGAADKSYSVFHGLQVPGAAPGAKLLSLQGVLKVSLDSIQLLYETIAGSNAKGFSLRLNNIGLKFFGLVKLPPGATINFFLFGAPGGRGSLGWYAAYIEDSNQKFESLTASGTESLSPPAPEPLALPAATAAAPPAHAPHPQENA